MKIIQLKKDIDEESEDASDNARDTEKSSSVYVIVIIPQGKVDMENQHIVIPVETNSNNKKSRKTFYESIIENYFK